MAASLVLLITLPSVWKSESLRKAEHTVQQLAAPPLWKFQTVYFYNEKPQLRSDPLLNSEDLIFRPGLQSFRSAMNEKKSVSS